MDPTSRPTPRSARTPLRGLSQADSERTVKAFFKRFAWEPSPFDPRVLSAAQFLDRLRE
ncbi:MAG: hypothetical protein NVS3B10_23880 [Polyangiales bacterium]